MSLLPPSLSTAPAAFTFVPGTAGASQTVGGSLLGSGASNLSNRDAALADFSTTAGSVNLLAQAAAAQNSNAADAAFTLPALPPMPAPQPAPAVPTDDHGTSNVVFADPDADGDLIH